MGYFPNSHDFTVRDSQMNDVAGNQTNNDHSNNVTNVNSGNTNNTTITGAFNTNHSTFVHHGDTHNTNEAGGTFNHVVGTQVNKPQGNSSSSRRHRRQKPEQATGGRPSVPPFCPPNVDPYHAYASHPQAHSNSTPVFGSNNPFARYAYGSAGQASSSSSMPPMPHMQTNLQASRWAPRPPLARDHVHARPPFKDGDHSSSGEDEDTETSEASEDDRRNDGRYKIPGAY